MHTDLAERLRIFEDERAIRRTLDDYGRAIDYGDDAGWLALFAEHATLELRYRAGLQPRNYGAPDRIDARLVYSGQRQLATFIAAHSKTPDRYHKHIVTNVRVDLTGDAADCESYFLRVDEIRAAPVIVAAGRYIDRLARTNDGRWRFTRRIAEIEARLRTD